jgi:peptidoglycan/xylan/chitin deacetylase (PgdA/CDA1 family)
LPVPPGAANVPKPSGTPGNLTVINWAGFKGAVSYTFDDNVGSQIARYEDLNAVGVPMTFYLVAKTVGSNSTWVKAVQDGHELGNHTVHHCHADGTGCSWAPGQFTTIDDELDSCTAKIKSEFGVDPYTFAAPFADSDGWGAAALKRFILNRSVGSGTVPANGGNPASLPCFMAEDGTTASTWNSLSDGARTAGAWQIMLVHNVDDTITDDGYGKIKTAELIAAMTYTKSLADVWTDTMVSIGGYWRAQKTLTAVQAATTGTTKTYSWKLPQHFPPGQYVRATVTGGKVMQCGTELAWDDHGYYEINLDAGSVTVSP